MVTCSLVPAAVTAVPRADLQHLVSGTHQCSRLLPPPSQRTGRHLLLAQCPPALRGTNVLWLLGDRTGQTLDFKGTRERHPQAGCPYSSTHLPSQPSRDLTNQDLREGALWSD